MSETLIPTMSFRWIAPHSAALTEQPYAKRLQQRYETPAGKEVWRDVPIVYETDPD